MNNIHHPYMHRCIQLARQGAGVVAPNPMVGAVLVYNDKIIGEGWHQQFGGPHAEVNCINDALARENAEIIRLATLYVSLEPCAHMGKTPPCADLIIQHRIPRVVIGCRDPFEKVNGRGIEKLKAAGVEVIADMLQDECKELNKRFFCFHEKKRPYIILKWAETGDGFMGGTSPNGSTSGNTDRSRLHISNKYTDRLVHKWRSKEASILVGTNTALLDDPELTTRLWTGPSPIRLVVDMELKLPASLKLFNHQVPTIVFNTVKHDLEQRIKYYQVHRGKELVPQIVTSLYDLNIQSVLVEGGAKLLQSFIDAGIWDEARRIYNRQLAIGNDPLSIGSLVQGPELKGHTKINAMNISSDVIETYVCGSAI